MFSVYGSSGRLFRGTLEQMRQIHPVHAPDRTRSIEPVLRDGRDSALREALDAESRPGTEVHRAVLTAYAPPRQPPGQRWSATPVSAVMSRDVVTLADTLRLRQAWEVLERHGIGQAPVVNAGATLVGLVTRAVLACFDQWPKPGSPPGAWQALQEKTVASIMLTPVPGVAPDAQLRRVASALLESGLPGLPVVDEAGLVTGFVSRSDILRAALDDAGLDLWG